MLSVTLLTKYPSPAEAVKQIYQSDSLQSLLRVHFMSSQHGFAFDRSAASCHNLLTLILLRHQIESMFTRMMQQRVLYPPPPQRS